MGCEHGQVTKTHASFVYVVREEGHGGGGLMSRGDVDVDIEEGNDKNYLDELVFQP